MRHGTNRRDHPTGQDPGQTASRLMDWSAATFRRDSFCLIGLVLLVALAAVDGTGTEATYRSVVIAGVPFEAQKPDFCGEACAAMWLQKLGHRVDQDYVFDRSGLDPAEGRGCDARELRQALTEIGFEVGPTWYRITAGGAGELENQWAALHADLLRGIPSIVCMRTAEAPDAAECFRLVLGYETAGDEVLYHEPADAHGAYRRMKRPQFLSLWPLKHDSQRWTVVRLRLAAGRLQGLMAASEGFTSADFAQHMMQLHRKLPEGFTSVIEPPFVVIGDDPPGQVRRYAEGTVRWTVRLLKNSFFQTDPTEIIDIWLFRDEESYQRHCPELFGEKPTTPYGFFSHENKALVMNIATGTGTLVHEIVHPFVAADFPQCPTWLNEGLGSLYEQCHEVDGRIRGRTNWRLAGLQKAIREGRLPAIKALCTTSSDEFYGDRRGIYYAQARYLCYYLQEAGLLEKFYRTFRDNYRKDAFGWKTLQAVLGREDMEAFQRQWQQFVLELQFP